MNLPNLPNEIWMVIFTMAYEKIYNDMESALRDLKKQNDKYFHKRGYCFMTPHLFCTKCGVKCKICGARCNPTLVSSITVFEAEDHYKTVDICEWCIETIKTGKLKGGPKTHNDVNLP